MRHMILSTLLFLTYPIFAQPKIEGYTGSHPNYTTQFKGTNFTVERNDGYAIIDLNGKVITSGIKAPTIGFSKKFLIDYGVFFAQEDANIVLKNLSGQAIGKGKYKEIRPFITDNTVVRLHSPSGTMVVAYLDTTGKEIIRFDVRKYLSIVRPPNKGKSITFVSLSDFLPFSEGLTPIQSDVNGKYGYIDKGLKLTIPVTFQEACPFSEGLAAVQNDDGNWGFINAAGKVIIPYNYSRRPSRFSTGLARVKNTEGNFGYINKQNKLVIPAKYKDATHFYKGYALVREDYNDPALLIDSTGTIVTKFPKDAAYINDDQPGPGISGKEAPEKPFYISETLQQLVDEKKGIFTKGFSYGLVDIEGNVVLDFKYDHLSDYHEGKMFAHKSEFIDNSTQHQYGIIDDKGKLVITIVKSEF